MHSEETIYFLTSATYQRAHWFARPEFAQLLIDQWQHYSERHDFRLDAYCVMPDHYHVVITLGSSGGLPRILHAVHSYVATLISETSHRRRKVKIWQGGTWDEVISDEDMYYQKVAYTLLNPWRAGLIENPTDEYRYSNLREWVEREGEEFVIDLFSEHGRWHE